MRLLLLLALCSCNEADAAGYLNNGRWTCSKSSDQPFNTSTLVNVNDMSFYVQAGKTYKFDFFLFFRSANTGVGPGFGLTHPGATQFGAAVQIPQANDATNSVMFGTLETSGDATVSNKVAVINTDYIAIIRGIIVPSVDGALQLQARNSSQSSAVTLKAGSLGTMEFYPL